MNVLPVIGRELQAAARHSFTYSLRVIGVAGLLVVCAVAGLDQRGPQFGPRLFSYLHNALLLAIWVFVPLLAADSISRERREGTLPLLFLTPLKPGDIVMAKGAVHGLRAFSLWLAVLPVLAVPLLAGGVGRFEAFCSLVINFSSICLALGAGLHASSMGRAWARCLALAMCWALLLGAALLCVAGVAVYFVARLSFPRAAPPWDGLERLLGMGFLFATNSDQVWGKMASAIPGRFMGVYLLTAGVGVWSVLALMLLVGIAASRVKRSWREEPPSARVQRLRSALCTPVVLQSFFRKWLSWELQRNPIGWLERRTWTGRLVVWSWLAVLATVYSSVISNLNLFGNGFYRFQSILAWFLVASLASSAAGSFRRERETGVLELLLVAPLNEWQIMGGRLRGLWGQFMPAIILFCGVWIYVGVSLDREAIYSFLFSWAMAFLCVPVVGLYYSLAKVSYLVAFLWTLLAAMLLPITLAQVPYLIGILAYYLSNRPFPPSGSESVTAVTAACLQLCIGYFFAWRLYSNLKRRRFALESRST